MEGIFGALFGILVAIAILWGIIGLAGATGDITAIAQHFESLCVKVSDWWNGVIATFTDSWDAIVGFVETIIDFIEMIAKLVG